MRTALRTLRRCTAALLALAGGAGAQPAEHAPHAHGGNPMRDAVDSAVQAAATAFLGTARPVGLVVGVLARGATRTYAYGETARGSGTRPTAHTLYPIASITKTFAATLLAQAVLEGRVRLDDDVRRHLPGPYPNLAFEEHPIRLAHLLLHRSGLPRALAVAPDGGSAPGAPRDDRAAFLAALRRVTLDTIPGRRFAYSNAGVQLLGYVLEDLYGMPFEALVAARVTRPLGMVDTRIRLTAADRARLAVGYDSAGVADPARHDPLQAAGALKSTAADLLRYARWQAAEEDAAVRLTHEPRVAYGGGYRMGLNWQMVVGDGGRTIWQDGSLPGYASLCLFAPGPGVGIVLLANGPDTMPGLGALADRVLAALDARAVRLP